MPGALQHWVLTKAGKEGYQRAEVVRSSVGAAGKVEIEDIRGKAAGRRKALGYRSARQQN